MKRLTLAAVLCMALFSCKKTDTTDGETSRQTVTSGTFQNTPGASGSTRTFTNGRTGIDGGFCGQVTSVNLMAGQNYVSGNVTIGNDHDSLYVTYSTNEGWKLKEIHLYVGPYNEAPLSGGGNPVPGKFDYKAAFIPQITSYTVAIPLATLDPCYIVAAHAVVVNTVAGGVGTQTGWAQGAQFPGNNWGMYVNYCTQSCL